MNSLQFFQVSPHFRERAPRDVAEGRVHARPRGEATVTFGRFPRRQRPLGADVLHPRRILAGARASPPSRLWKRPPVRCTL